MCAHGFPHASAWDQEPAAAAIAMAEPCESSGDRVLLDVGVRACLAAKV